MRLFWSLSALVLVVTPGVQAQDYFGDVTNEPRPSEFLHWDAEAYAEFKSQLEEDVANGDRTWGTVFVTTPALMEADYRPHEVVIIHRAGYTQPEIHETKWDIYVILDGSGTVRVGGERVGWIDGLAPEEQRPQLEGAQDFEVTVGDMVHIPARSWHQLVLDEGESMTYALINIFE